MVWNIVVLIAGFIFVLKGADLLVDGASSLAKRFRVSELTIGLTIVAFGTSAPELVVNIIAALKDLDNVILGNIVGSNIFNLLLILGIAGVIYPITVQSKTVWKEIPFSIFAGLLLLALANGSFFSSQGRDVLKWYDGLIFLIFFALFLYYASANLKDDSKDEADSIKVFGITKTVLYILGGFVLLVLGGRFVVNNAIALARILGFSEKVIGLTIVAAGTSFPELATSAVAAYKRRSDLAIGNVIGSNIFNILFILGITSLISPVRYDVSFNIDIFIYLGASLFIFIAMFTGKKKKLDRWEAVILLIAYVFYMIFLFRKAT